MLTDIYLVFVVASSLCKNHNIMDFTQNMTECSILRCNMLQYHTYISQQNL